MLRVQSRWRMCPQTSHGVTCEAWLGFHFSLQGVWKGCWEAAHPPLALISHILTLQVGVGGK